MKPPRGLVRDPSDPDALEAAVAELAQLIPYPELVHAVHGDDAEQGLVAYEHIRLTAAPEHVITAAVALIVEARERRNQARSDASRAQLLVTTLATAAQAVVDANASYPPPTLFEMKDSAA